MMKNSRLLALAVHAPLIAILATACMGQDAGRPLFEQELEREAWSLRVLTLDRGRSYTITDDGKPETHVSPDSKLVGNLLVEIKHDAIVTTNPATGETIHEVLLDKEFQEYRVVPWLIDFCPSLSTAFFVDGGWLYRHGPEVGTSRAFYIGDIGAGEPLYGADKRFEVSPDGAFATVIRSSPDRFEDNSARDRYGDVMIFDLERKDLLHILPGDRCYWLSDNVLAVVDMSDEIVSHKWQLKLWSKEEGVFLEETIQRMTLAIGQGEFSIVDVGENVLLHRRALDGSALGSLILPDSVEIPDDGITYYAIREDLPGVD